MLRLTALITTHNRCDFLRAAVESVLAQTRPADEILIVDAGSTDRTAEYVRSLGDAVRSLAIPESGIAAARNAGLRHCAGDAVAFLDDDDLWTTDKLAQVSGYLEQHPNIDVVYTPVAAMNAAGQLLPRALASCPSGWMLGEVFNQNPIHDSTVTIRRQVWQRFGGFDATLPLSAGQHYWLRLAMANPIGHIDRPLTLRRQHAGQASVQNPARTLRIQAEMLHRFYEDEQGRERLNRERARRTLAKLCQHAGQLHWQQGDIAKAARLFRGALLYGPSWRSRWNFFRIDRLRQRGQLPELLQAVWE
ncbi:glycosyltransferase [bacterium]|nr:glycosyltransferase [bacterium]